MFNAFSGYRLNFSESEVMPLGSLKRIPKTQSPFPLKWSLEGFVYLGIRITPLHTLLWSIIKSKFPTHIQAYKAGPRETEHPPNFLIGPCTLENEHPSQVTLPNTNDPSYSKTIKKLNSWFSSIIWSKKKLCLKIAALYLSSTEGGVDPPDIRKFQLSAHLHTIAEWIGCSISKCPNFE